MRIIHVGSLSFLTCIGLGPCMGAARVLNDLKPIDTSTALLRIRNIQNAGTVELSRSPGVSASETVDMQFLEFESFALRATKGSYDSSSMWKTTVDYSKTTVNCDDHEDSGDNDIYAVEFYYAVQTTIDNDPVEWIDNFEAVFLDTISKTYLKCSESNSKIEGCTSLKSLPRDSIASNKFCDVTEPGAKSCTVMKGEFSVVVSGSKVTNETKEKAHAEIVKNMKNNSFISPDISEIVHVDLFDPDEFSMEIETNQQYPFKFLKTATSCDNNDYSDKNDNTYGVEFYYAVQTSVENDLVEWADKMEEGYLHSLSEALLECSESDSEIVGCTSLISRPKDEIVLDKFCGATEPGAKSCTVMKGQFKVVVSGSEVSDETKKKAHEAVVEIIENDGFINTETPEVVHVDLYNSLEFLMKIESDKNNVDKSGSSWGGPMEELEKVISCDDSEDSDSKDKNTYTVEFYYAVQTTVEEDPIEWAGTLEEGYLRTLSEMFLDCSESNSIIEGCISVISEPKDEVLSDKSCDVTEHSAMTCTVMKGEFSLIVSGSEVSDETKKKVYKAIVETVESNKFVHSQITDIVRIDVIDLTGNDSSFPTNISCPNDNGKEKETHELKFLYGVQTTIENDPVNWIDEIEYKFLETLSKSFLNCPDATLVYTHRLLTEGCTSVGSLPKDEILPDKICPTAEPNAMSCTVMQGQLTITGSNMTDYDKSAALKVITDGMRDDSYIDNITIPEIVKVDLYTESLLAASLVDNPMKEYDQSWINWILGLMLLLIILAVLVVRRRNYLSKDDDSFDSGKKNSVDSEDTFDLDDDASDTRNPDDRVAHVFQYSENDFVGGINGIEGYQDGDTYLAPDFKTPGKKHSRLDVHQCNSVMCETCLALKQGVIKNPTFESVYTSNYCANANEKTIS
uniref:Uncharacterized protein n=2 Tax=Corethron hystrix TaxID=216773 RepID=A0A7S1FP53_9STRA|mmetsp:Transcript_17798/g.40410  ORF Transcript_17798/g.40410 Transcript_17798/m.40410 type:complete len:909 (+) Transcript_17798:329-3055(+)